MERQKKQNQQTKGKETKNEKKKKLEKYLYFKQKNALKNIT